MKRFLPIGILVLIGLLGIGTAFWFFRSPGEEKEKKAEKKEERVIRELSLEEKPFVSLVPGVSCEYTLNVSNIQRDADQLEYEVVYEVESGVTQGVPGTIALSGKTSVSRELLFGTESSGHRRCDKGVEDGEITVKYRDGKGSLIAKASGKFKVFEGEDSLSLDGFEMNFGRTVAGKLVVMETLGLPGKAPAEVKVGPIGVFGSAKISSVQVEMDGEGTIYGWNGKSWVEIENEKSSFLGTFIKAASN